MKFHVCRAAVRGVARTVLAAIGAEAGAAQLYVQPSVYMREEMDDNATLEVDSEQSLVGSTAGVDMKLGARDELWRIDLDAGMAVSDPAPYGRLAQHVTGDSATMLVEEAGAPFTLESLVHGAGELLQRDQGPFWFIPLQGSGLIDGQPWVSGECWLIEDRADIAVAQPLHALLARPAA